MKSFMQGFKRFVAEEDGVTMIEYGLIAALIAVVCIAAITTIGTNLDLVFDKVGEKLVVPAGA